MVGVVSPACAPHAPSIPGRGGRSPLSSPPSLQMGAVALVVVVPPCAPLPAQAGDADDAAFDDPFEFPDPSFDGDDEEFSEESSAHNNGPEYVEVWVGEGDWERAVRFA